MNWKLRLALWLGRKCGVDLRPWTPEMEQALAVGRRAGIEIETLTLALEKVSAAYHAANKARDSAESAYKNLLEGKVVSAPAQVWDLVPRARELATSINEKAADGISGEFKRHEVYARLIKDFPASDKRDIGLAIELALRA